MDLGRAARFYDCGMVLNFTTHTEGFCDACLARKKNERIVIAENITVTVVQIRGDKVRLGFEAPREVTIDRHEVHEAKLREGRLREEASPGEDAGGGAHGYG